MDVDVKPTEAQVIGERNRWRVRLRELNTQAFVGYPTKPAEVGSRVAKMDKIQRWLNKAKVLPRKYSMLIQEAKQLNFSQYLDEVCQAQLKPALPIDEVNSMAQLISVFHQDYEQYSSKITAALCRYVALNDVLDQQLRALRKTSLLLLLCQLFLCGLPMPIQKILIALKDIFSNKEIKKTSIYNFSIAASFIQRFSYEFIGRKSQVIEQLQAEGHQFLTNLVPLQKKQKLGIFFQNFLDWFCKQFNELIKFLGKPESKQLQDKTNQLIAALQKSHQQLGIKLGQIALPPPKPVFNYLPQELVFENQMERDFYSKLPECQVIGLKHRDSEQQRNQFNNLIKSLNIDSVEKADLVAKQMLKQFNTVRYRRLLAQQFFNRRQNHGVNFWTRMLSTLAKYQKDFCQPLFQMFRERYQKSKKGGQGPALQQRRKRLVRIFSQFVKFKVYSVDRALFLMRELTDTLTVQYCQPLLILLEGCGRFLFVSRPSAPRMKENLDYLSLTIKASCLPISLVNSLISKMNELVPGNEPVRKPTKTRSQEQQNIRQLIMFDLNQNNFEQIAESLCSMPKEGLQLKLVYRIIKTSKRCSYFNLRNLAVLVRVLSENLVGFVPLLLHQLQKHFKENVGQSSQDDISLSTLYGQLYRFEVIDRQRLQKFMKQNLQPDNRVLRIQMFIHTFTAIQDYFAKESYFNLKFQLLLTLLAYADDTQGIPEIRKFQLEDLIEKNLRVFMPLVLTGKAKIFKQQLKVGGDPLIKQLQQYLLLEVQKQQERAQEQLNEEEQHSQRQRLRQERFRQLEKEDQHLNTEFQKEFSNHLEKQLQSTIGKIVKPVCLEEKVKPAEGKGKKLLVRIGRTVVQKNLKTDSIHQ